MPEDTAAILVPVGGGGLIAGIATWLRANRPEVKIIGVEPAGAASMHVALEAGQPMSLAKVDPFVDGTAVGRAGSLPFHIASQFVDSVLVVPEGAVCTEMLELYQSDGVIAEPAGALASTAAHTKKNNRELGPALVGIDLSNPDDIDGLRHRMEASPLHVEELPLDSEITRLVI